MQEEIDNSTQINDSDLPANNNVEREVEKESRKQVMLQQQHFSGPLPPAKELARYNDIIPNGADRIMSMAEKEQQGRHDFEREALGIQKTGQTFGLIAIVVFFVFSFYLVSEGHANYGAWLMGGGAVTIAAAFISGRKNS